MSTERRHARRLTFISLAALAALPLIVAAHRRATTRHWRITTDLRLTDLGLRPDDDDEINLSKQRVRLEFEGGASYTFRASSVFLRRDEDRVKRIAFLIGPITQRDAHALITKMIDDLQLENTHSVDHAHALFDEWEAGPDAPWHASSPSAGNHDRTPRVFVEVGDSFNESRPWIVRLYLNW